MAVTFVKSNTIPSSKNTYILNYTSLAWDTLGSNLDKPLCKEKVINIRVKTKEDTLNYGIFAEWLNKISETYLWQKDSVTFVLPKRLSNNLSGINFEIVAQLLEYLLKDFEVIIYESLHNRVTNWEDLPPTIHGWGINDIVEKVKLKEFIGYSEGKRLYKDLWVCPYYSDWKKDD